MEGIFIFGTINGTAERPYSFTDQSGQHREGVTRLIRIEIGEQMDLFDQPEKIYAEVRVPEKEWDRLRTKAVAMQNEKKAVYMRVNPHSMNRNGHPVVTATVSTDILELDSTVSKLAKVANT